MEDKNIIKFPKNSRVIDMMEDLEELEEQENPVHLVYEGLSEKLPELTSLVVIGQDTEGRFFFASSDLKVANILYDLKTAEYLIMSQG